MHDLILNNYSASLLSMEVHYRGAGYTGRILIKLISNTPHGLMNKEIKKYVNIL